jgi:hypothetical protein
MFGLLRLSYRNLLPAAGWEVTPTCRRHPLKSGLHPHKENLKNIPKNNKSIVLVKKGAII